MTTGMEWQTSVGATWAEAYPLTDRSFAGLTQQLLDRIAAISGNRVLDIGCGAGELALAVARARPQAQVTGIDISSDLIAAARQRGEQRVNVRFDQSDAMVWQPEQAAPDLLISRHGVMFFPDPVAAFTHFHDLAAPDAALIFSCFRDARDNPWASELGALLGITPGDPHAPGPFAFAEPDRIRQVLRGAGWSRIDLRPVDFAYVAGHGDDPVADALGFFHQIGPSAAEFRRLDGMARETAEDLLRGWLEQNRSDNLVVFAGAAWIVEAHKA